MEPLGFSLIQLAKGSSSNCLIPSDILSRSVSIASTIALALALFYNFLLTLHRRYPMKYQIDVQDHQCPHLIR